MCLSQMTLLSRLVLPTLIACSAFRCGQPAESGPPDASFEMNRNCTEAQQGAQLGSCTSSKDTSKGSIRQSFSAEITIVTLDAPEAQVNFYPFGNLNNPGLGNGYRVTDEATNALRQFQSFAVDPSVAVEWVRMSASSGRGTMQYFELSDPTEKGDTAESATELELNESTVVGYGTRPHGYRNGVGPIPSEDTDYYKFEVARPGLVTLTVTTSRNVVDGFVLFPTQLDKVVAQSEYSTETNSPENTKIIRYQIEKPGTYYARLEFYDAFKGVLWHHQPHTLEELQDILMARYQLTGKFEPAPQ